MDDVVAKVQIAFAVTGVVFTIATVAMGVWVSEQSGRKVQWHRPLVAGLGAVAGLMYILAAWVGVMG